MSKKITQYPASSGNPDVGSVFDISELSNGTYTSKKITLSQLLTYMNANLTFNTGTKRFLNSTANTLSNGALVSIQGGSSTLASVSTHADANDINGQLYVAIENVAGNVSGNFISEGVVNNLNTNAYNVGTKLYWNFTLNTFTDTIVTNGSTIFYGVVLVKSSSVGAVYVSPCYDFDANINGDNSQVALFEKRDKVTGNVHFTYVDNVGTEVGYRIQDGLNNLTQLAISFVNIETEGASQPSISRLANWSDANNMNIAVFRKSRGDKTYPTQLLTDDIIGTTIYTGQAIKDVTGTGYPIQTSVGMTIAEVMVRAKANLYKIYDNIEVNTISNALAQYEIYLQSSNASIAGDYTPLNKLVFAVDGDGKVQFKNYSFPSTQGAIGTTLISNGSQLIWGNPSASSATTLQTIGRNSTGSTLRKGTVVYISGSTGNRPNFVKAKADAEATSAGTFGVVVSDIANNSDGYVVTIGTIEGLDTRSNATYPFTTDTLVDGDTLYLSPTTAGYVTNVKPSAPNHIVYVGKVTITSPTNGAIVYRIQNGYELEELHNVAISTTPTDGQVLTYETATSLWKAKTPVPITTIPLNYKQIAFGNSNNLLDMSQYFSYDDGFLNIGTSTTATKTPCVNLIGQSNSNSVYPIFQFNRFLISAGPYVSLNYIIGAISSNTRTSSTTGAIDILRMVATENHSTTNAGQDVVMYSVPNGGVVNKEVIRLLQNGKLQISGVYSMPSTDGTSGQILTTDGLGNVSWSSASSLTDFIPKLIGTETFRGVTFSNNSTTEVTYGGVVTSLSTGSGASARSVASTNFASRTIRKGFVATTVSTDRVTNFRGTALLWYMSGGFKYVCDFYISDTAYGSACKQFYGMAGQTTDLAYSSTIAINTLLNIIGVGSDASDANLQIYYNDGTGTATKIDLGASFPANRTSGSAMTTIYSVVIYNPSGTNTIKVQVTNKETGAVSQNTLTTNLPDANTGLNWFATRMMGTAVTGTGQFDLNQIGVYSI